MTQNNHEQTMKPLLAGCAHGTHLRGLMAVASSPNFQGRFGKMFRLPAASYGATDDESRTALRKLGDFMTSDFDAPTDGPDDEESGIPALYTYFGQFIDHDLTFDPVSTLARRSDPNALTNFRTPAFDLDNMYGRGPDDQPYLYKDNKSFLLGDLLDNGAPDLLRNHATPARAIIGDPRNDENSIVSQFQALMLRFHNRVVIDNPELDFASIQRIVRWHYQWVVIHDFLPRIITQSVLDDLKTDGQYDERRLRFYKFQDKPFLPVEFSVAAYRLGHSMIRSGYRLNDIDSTLLPIFPISATIAPPNGLPIGLTGFQAMAKDHGIDWGRFIDVGSPRAYGGDPDGPNQPPSLVADNKRRLQLAYRLDTSLVEPLANLPESVAADPPPSLAQRNLIRGFDLNLPNGQSIARAMHVTPLRDSEILIGKAVDHPESGDVRGSIADIPDLAPFRNNCPLWTYILAEAMQHKKQDVVVPVLPQGTHVSTPQLGPVGGRIVAEVFLGLLFADQTSFIAYDSHWIPTIGSAKTNFALRDIVAYALGS